MAFNPFGPPKRPDAPSFEEAYQQASRQTAANAAAYRPQRVNPQDMKAQLAQKLAAWRAQPRDANGRRALPVGTPQLPYQRVDPNAVFGQMMGQYNQRLAEWQRQKAEWDRQQEEFYRQQQQQNSNYDGGGGGDGTPGGLGDAYGGANPGGEGGGYGGGGYGDAGGSPAGDGGGTMGGAMRRGGLVAKYSKGGLVSNSFSEMSRKLAKKRSK